MCHIWGNYGCDVYVPGKDSFMGDNLIYVGSSTMLDKVIVYIMNLMDINTEVRESQYNYD